MPTPLVPVPLCKLLSAAPAPLWFVAHGCSIPNPGAISGVREQGGTWHRRLVLHSSKYSKLQMLRPRVQRFVNQLNWKELPYTMRFLSVVCIWQLTYLKHLFFYSMNYVLKIIAACWIWLLWLTLFYPCFPYSWIPQPSQKSPFSDLYYKFFDHTI